jgi:hypothetical protein
MKNTIKPAHFQIGNTVIVCRIASDRKPIVRKRKLDIKRV